MNKNTSTQPSNNKPTLNNIKHRQIKSFVLRQGKITPGQQKALEKLISVYGVMYQHHPADLIKSFDNSNPIIIEIGFGMGHGTFQTAKDHPNNNYLGIEVHTPGVGSLLMQLDKNPDVTNLKIIQHDAKEVLQNMIPDNSITGFHIYFPDPWPKKRHHKRRIIQPQFIELLTNKLKVGGYIHLATDWEDYALWMLDVLNGQTRLHNQSLSDDYITRPAQRPLTKFEQRGIKLGHGVWDLIFRKE
jgi:tRNA (guanine-N7-)-methyltransferase